MNRLTTKDGQTLDALAAKGAARLDVRRPNWFKDIDLNDLEMTSSCRCICGQLYGMYNEKSLATIIGGWVKRLIYRDYEDIAAEYGFAVPVRIDEHYFGMQAWNRLDNAWKREVRARRASA